MAACPVARLSGDEGIGTSPDAAKGPRQRSGPVFAVKKPNPDRRPLPNSRTGRVRRRRKSRNGFDW